MTYILDHTLQTVAALSLLDFNATIPKTHLTISFLQYERLTENHKQSDHELVHTDDVTTMESFFFFYQFAYVILIDPLTSNSWTLDMIE